MVLMRPFVPYSDDDQRQQLTAFMAARMDAENYGQLLVYEMPSSDLPEGPGIASAAIQTDERVSTLETELGRGGSEVRYGNLLLVPIDQALLYVQPFYVVPEDQTRQVPLLERVIANYGDQVVIADTLAEAMEEIFGEQPVTREEPGEEGTVPDEGEGTPSDEDTVPSGDEAEELLADAQALFTEAEEALADGDLGTYQERVDEAGRLVNEAIELLGGTAASDAGSSSDDTSSDDTSSDDTSSDATEAEADSSEEAESTTTTTEATAAAATSTPA
jgi:hypothetical protein